MDASENSPIFTDLSHELLCSILEYLPLRKILSMGMLCKKLLSAVDMHLRLCKNIDFCQDKIHGYMPSSITDDHIHTLLKKCPQLETVYGLHPVKVERRRLRKRSALTVPGIIEALSLCLHLKAIETSDLRLFEAVMQLLPQLEIIGHFQNRDGVFPPQASQRLKLHPYPRISSLHLIGVEVPELTAMPHLQHLHLQCVRFTKLQPFRAFLAHNLRSFVMKHCMGPSASLRYLSLIIALSSSPNLSHLELVRVPLPGGLFQRAVEDSHRHNGFVNLKTLVISGCKFVLEADLGHLMIVSSKNLETLYIQPSLTKDSLFVSLSFAQCTFPSLRNLHLGYMDILNSSGEWSNDALVSLGLAEVPDTPSSLTDSGIKVINQLFRGLKSLSVSNCPHLMSMQDWQPGEGMRAWPQLTDLTLQRCHCLQLASFTIFVPDLHSLQVIILKDMFREPPKGCSHVGLSAGTGLGMSSAVVSNQDEHIAVQGHHQDFDHPGEEDNEENEREFIDVENDDNQEPHFMVLQGDFFDAEDDDIEIYMGDGGSFNHQQGFDTGDDFDDDSPSLDSSLSDDVNDQKVSSKKSKKKSTSHLRRSKRTLRSSKSNVKSEHTGDCSQSANADPMDLEGSSFESDEFFDGSKKSVKSKQKGYKNIRGYDPHQPSTSKAGRHLDYSFSSDTNSSDSEIYKNSKLNGSKKREKKLQLSEKHSKKSKIKKSPKWSDTDTCSCSGFDTDDDRVVVKKRIKVEESLLDEHSQLTKPCCVRVTRLEDDISLSDQVSKISNETVGETCSCMLNESTNKLPSTSKVHKCICIDKKSKHNLVAPEEIASHQNINLTNDERVRCNSSDNELLINNVQRNICINNEINSSLTGEDLLKSMSCYVRITKIDNKAISTSKSHVKDLELTGNISEQNQLESPENIVCSDSVSSVKLGNSFDSKRHERIEQSTKQINSRQDCPLVSDYSTCFKTDTSSISVGVCGNLSKNDSCFDDTNKSVEANSEINEILTPADEFQSFASTSSSFVSKNNGKVSVDNSEIPENAESFIMMPELKDGSSMNKSVYKNECNVKSVSNNNNDCDQIIDVSEILTENVSSNSNEKLFSDPFHCSVNLNEVKNETDTCSSQISPGLNSIFINKDESIQCDTLVKLENTAESICSVSKDICQTSEMITDASFVNEAFSEMSHDTPSTSSSKNCKQAPPCTSKDVEVPVTSQHSTKTIENEKLKKSKSQNVYLKQSVPVIINSSVDRKQISKITPCHVLIPKLEDDILSDSKEYELVQLENSLLCNPCQPSTSKNIFDSSDLSRQSANTSHPLEDKSCHALIKQEVMSPNHSSNDSIKPLNLLPSWNASNSVDNNLSCKSGKCSVVIKRIEDNGLYIDLESEKIKINCDTTKPSMSYNSEMNAGSYSCLPSTSKIENSADISDHDSKSSHPPLKKLKKSADDYSDSNYYIQISDDLQGSIKIVNSVTGESHNAASCSVRVSKLSSKDCNKPKDFSKNKSVNKCNISEKSCEKCKSHLTHDPSLPSTSKANLDMDLCQSNGAVDNYLHSECSSSDKKSGKKSSIKDTKRNQKSKKICCNVKIENIDTANCKSGNSSVSKNSLGTHENSSNMSETVKSIERLKIKNSDAAIILKKKNSPEKGFDSDIKPTSCRIKCESDVASNISSDNLSQFRYRKSPCRTTWEMSTENESTSAAIISVLAYEGKRKKKNKVLVSQSTQATSSDIRRSVRGIPRIALRARRSSLNLGKRKRKIRSKRISDTMYIRKLRSNPLDPGPECWDKSTSTSDPLLEDDAVQRLEFSSDSLLSFTIVSCGISDLSIQRCPLLFHVEVQACRILKNIKIDYGPSMKRLNISQCPKLNIHALVLPVLSLATDSYLLVSYEPCMQSYHPGYGEKAILSKAALNQSVLLCHDVFDISDESIQANFREKMWEWLHYLSRLHGTLNYTREKSKRKSFSENSPIPDYPWSHDLRRKHGQYVCSPTTEFCETEGQYQLLTNNPIFCEAFETHKMDIEIPSVDDCEACKDNSLLSYEAVEKYCQMQKKFIGFYIPITENNRINTYKHIQTAS